MNTLLVGTADTTERLLQLASACRGFLLIDDGPVADAFAREFDVTVFDPHEDSFNPLKGMDYKRARDFVALLYSLSPQGENTLTVRNGRRALLRLLLQKPPRLDRLRATTEAEEEAVGLVKELLLSPVLEHVLCRPTNVSLKPTKKIVARLNRAELGDFDALVLGTLLIGQFTGQVIVPDFGFYGFDFYVSLIRQQRLVAGVQFLEQLPVTLRQALLIIRQKEGSGCTFEDAETLAKYAGHSPGTVAHSEFTARAMA